MRSPPGPGGEEGSLAPGALGWEEKGGGLEGRSMAESSRLASQLCSSLSGPQFTHQEMGWFNNNIYLFGLF